VTCQRYYLIECQHVAVLSARISPLGAGAFRSTFTCEPKSSCRTQDPRRPTYSDVKVPVSMEVWLKLVTTTSSWRRRKTRHEGQPPGGVERSGNSTRPAPKQRKRCVPHSRGTASEILEEGGDDVKSAWPLWAGPHTCYNGNDNGKQGCKAERIRKDCLSSDCSLQLGNMKLKSLVIADQHAAVNMYPGPVHTARHTLGIGFARSIGPMITHDFCVPLVPQRPLVVLLAHTTVGSSTGVKS
jgi:hypothetical protein